VPSELGGNGAGTNPEELLIAAAASCYALTFGSLAERQGLPVSQVRVSCEGAFEFEAGLQLASLAYRVVARMRAGVSEEEIAKAQRALERCEQLCMVATALRGNVRSHLDLVVEREGSS